MNVGFDARPAQLRAVAAAMPGPYFGGKFATSSKACFPYHLALSIELAYIECIFLPIHIDCIFFFPVKHKFSVLCRSVTLQSM